MAKTALKPEPQGEWLSEQEIAKRVGIHRQTLAARLDDLGYEPDPERSHVKLKMYFFTDAMKFEILAAKDEMSAMKIRDLRAAAETREFKLAVMRRDYVEASEMVELVQKIVGSIYQELTLRQIKRIGGKLAKAKNVTEIKKILNADNSRIMKNLRENFERVLG